VPYCPRKSIAVPVQRGAFDRGAATVNVVDETRSNDSRGVGQEQVAAPSVALPKGGGASGVLRQESRPGIERSG